VLVTLDFHTLPPDAIFILKDSDGKKLAKINGNVKNHYPLYLQSCPQRLNSGCSGYEVVVVNGITEIIQPKPYREHENMEQNGRIVALFYVIDDPAVRQELLADCTGRHHAN
jgi:hypothetical protein